MNLAISTIKNEIRNLERFLNNHKRNDDKENIDYLQWRIDKHLKAIEILQREANKESASDNAEHETLAGVSNNEVKVCLPHCPNKEVAKIKCQWFNETCFLCKQTDC